MSKIHLAACAAIAAASLVGAPAYAASQIENGDFETGDFTGWNVSAQLDSQGDFFVVPNNGGPSPILGNSYQVNPDGGRFFAMTDQSNPGSYALTQTFHVTASHPTIHISFQLFANNYPGTDFNNGRDFHTDPNQNAVADILTAGDDPLSNSPVQVLYGPGSDHGATPNPWQTYGFDVTLAPGKYQIRFAETDNQGPFNLGVDNVSISGVPEPGTWAMTILGLAALGLAARRRRTAFIRA